ncbi:MAG: ABC transporter ATP-binding protein, partial [Clostridia bacterium]|nr:ABC transporter ATP-binding protein [Clostridia bacterium]
KRAQIKNRLELADVNREISYYMTMLIDENYANDMRMYSISGWVIAKYKKAVAKTQQLTKKLIDKMAVNGSVRNVLSVIELAVYYVFLAVRVIYFNLSFADFTMVLTALNTFSTQVTGIAGNIINLAENSVYIEAYRKLIQTKNSIAVDNQGVNADLITDTGTVYRIENMCFRYPGNNQYVLDNVNLTVEKNKFYVIVGENGEGKSTLCKLLCRLYDVSEGKILYNGTDIRSIDFKSYRNKIGIVFQDYKYYALSIAENVAMNEYENTGELRAKVYDALCKAGLKEKIDSLPGGIDTKLGKIFDEDGVLLSGGELQKLALARVLFKNQPIVILDEPSSALDAFAEDELIRAFNSSLKGKTVFYISHRLSVAKYADEVVFIHNHTVEAVGTHSDLMVKCKKYAEMYNIQAKHYIGDFASTSSFSSISSDMLEP